MSQAKVAAVVPEPAPYKSSKTACKDLPKILHMIPVFVVPSGNTHIHRPWSHVYNLTSFVLVKTWARVSSSADFIQVGVAKISWPFRPDILQLGGLMLVNNILEELKEWSRDFYQAFPSKETREEIRKLWEEPENSRFWCFQEASEC